MKRILLAGLLGGIAAYIWGAISWTLMPWNMATLHGLPNDRAVSRAIADSTLESGVYYFPNMPSDEQYAAMTEEQQKAWMKEYEASPTGLVVYNVRGENPNSPQPFIGGLLLFLLSSFTASWLLSRATGSLGGYWSRVIFVGGLGLFAALVSYLAQWNWHFLTTCYALGHAFDLVAGWLIAGAVIAWRITPEQPAAG